MAAQKSLCSQLPEPGYRIATKAGITASTLSRLLHDVDPVRLDDPRVIAIAKVVGISVDEAFEERESN